MADLTVGYVSGIIAAAHFVVQLFLPTALALILAGLLKEENTAATWTQVSRALHSTYWPTIVGADSAVSGTVSRLVRFQVIFQTIALGTLAIAAIVTPLGLYDAIVPSTSTVSQPFEYGADTSPFGYGTPPRSGLGFNRQCGNKAPVACPGSKSVVLIIDNGTDYKTPYGYDTSIPDNITEAFQSGLKDFTPTVSSIYDIQWRSYRIDTDEKFDNGTGRVVGSYRQLQTLVLNDGIDIVEGLIVDTKNGFVGLRNHTIPSPLQYGSEWSEDLLFIEPVTQCVDTNLTLDYTLSDSLAEQTRDMVLTDRGGFVNLNTTYPYLVFNDTQNNPDMLSRAYKAAYMTNVLTMLYMNVSNPRTEKLEPFAYLDSTMNKTFPVDSDFMVDAGTLYTSTDYGSFLSLPVFADSNFTSNTSAVSYPNPFELTTSNFTSIHTLCQGAGGLDYGNMSNIGVSCGLVMGAARRADLTDESSSLIFNYGTKWSVPLYSCASTTRAVIKSVGFRYNGTDGLKSLTVRSIEDKLYKSDDDKPLWGVENTGMELQDTKPVWGLVSDEYRNKPGIDVLQKESLYLPGFTSNTLLSTSPTTSYMNLPGVSFHMDAYSTVYNIQPGAGANGVADYSGSTNLAMYAKWQDLSSTANTTVKMINLMWTDIVANAIVGTRGWLGTGDTNGDKRTSVSKRAVQFSKRADDREEIQRPEEGQLVDVPVTVFDRKVKYHFEFAIPAFIVLALALVVAATSLVLCVCGRARPSRVKKFLFHTAAGRIMASFVYPGQVESQAPSKVWNNQVGSKRINAGSPVPQAADPVMMGHYANTYNTKMDDPLIYKEASQSVNMGSPTHGLNAHPQAYSPNVTPAPYQHG